MIDIVERKIELLAPGGDIDSIKAAILGGADAVYCGLDKFNARNRAVNISLDDLKGILRLAHKNSCDIFITLNIIIVEEEISALVNLLNKLVNTGIDGIIIQDLAMFHLVSKYFKSLDIHASTQMTTHNEGQIKFLAKLGSTRVNLCREMNISEIKHLSAVGAENNILTEVFVHGSNCISFSGLCYISSVHAGNSGNRGRCSQPCRGKHNRTSEGKDFPLNLKDNSAFFDLQELYDAGVYSLKIEGRIKKFDYVYTVVNSWRKHIDSLYNKQALSKDNSIFYKVFNRDFSNTYLKGDINKDMFIDDPRDHSIKHLSVVKNYESEEKLEEARLKLYEEKSKIMRFVEDSINEIDISKLSLHIIFSGEAGMPLKVLVNTPDSSFTILSDTLLSNVGAEALSEAMILKRFKVLNDTDYSLKTLDLGGLKSKLYIAFKELTSIREKILFILNGSKNSIEAVEVPKLLQENKEPLNASLSVLISSVKDVDTCTKTNAKIYFQLPNSLKKEYSVLVEMFKKNRKLIPYFSSVIIGEDYNLAVDFLEELKPESIVTNNTGIAYEAYQRGISWLAGPYLNLVNSYSLLCLKENFNCSGAFISNELSKRQLRGIKAPKDFSLHYSIYHPLVLMTSRQCMFQQVDACGKKIVNSECISSCSRNSSITDQNGHTSYLQKSEGAYNSLYNDANYLNTDVLKDFPSKFSDYLIDLRDVKTETKVEIDKLSLINLFEDIISGNDASKEKINKCVHPTTNHQYIKGI